MKKITILILLLISIHCSFAQPQSSDGGTVRLGLLKYSGGGDWYANPTALPNLIAFCNSNLNMNINPDYVEMEAGSPEIFNLPFLHMTGHGNVVFNDQEAENLRNYLMAGGFLHIDDNYGMDPYIRPTMKKVFPELEFVELPFSHKIYKQAFRFDRGLPKIHQHDGKATQGLGLIYNGRLVCFYSYETDLGDGWEDPEVHNDPPNLRQQALEMGSNILQYVFTQ